MVPSGRCGWSRENGAVSVAECQILEAIDEDAGEILSLQRAAYQSEALLYDNPRLPPLRQALEDLRKEMRCSTCLKAVLAGRIVGSIRGRIEDDTCHVGRLIVAPDLQGRGIGTRLIEDLEGRFRLEVARFEVFTGNRSLRNINLYRRLGYREIRRQLSSEALELIFMEKPSPAG